GRQSGDGATGRDRMGLEAELAELEKAMKEVLDRALLLARSPGEFLSLAVALAAVGSVDGSLGALRTGRDKLLRQDAADPREGDALRAQLGQVLFEQAAGLEKRGSPEDGAAAPWWPLYRESLAEYLPLFKGSPYDRDLIAKVFTVISRFKTTPGAPDLQL